MFVTSVHCASGQTTATIRTLQTSLELRAGDRNPQVLSLGTGTAKTWRNNAPEKLIDSVVIEGRPVPVHWEFNRPASRVSNRRVAFVYDCASPKLQLTWEWLASASTGPVEHTVHIENLEAREIWIPMQDSFQFDLPIDSTVALEHFYVEKGAGAPSPVGTHQPLLPVDYHWNGTSSTYAHPAKGEPREVIPFSAIEKTDGTRSGWYVGIEFSGRTRLTVDRDATSLRGAVGLNPNPGPFLTRLKPREIFDAPMSSSARFRAG